MQLSYNKKTINESKLPLYLMNILIIWTNLNYVQIKFMGQVSLPSCLKSMTVM